MDHENRMRGDAEFARWYTTHHDRIRSLCARILLDDAAGEDLAQETLLKAWTRRESIREEDVGAWLTVVARNLCISYMRRHGRVVPTDAMPEVPDASADPLANIERLESRRAVRRAMRQIEERQRRALYLHEVNGADYEEIGQEFGLSAEGVRSIAFRARRVLRARLAAAGEGLGAWIFGVKVRFNRLIRSNPPLTDVTATAALQAGLSIALAAGIVFGGAASEPRIGSIADRGAAQTTRLGSADRAYIALATTTHRTSAQQPYTRSREHDVTGPVMLSRRGEVSAPIPGSKGLFGTGYEVGIWRGEKRKNPLPYDGSIRQQTFDFVIETACAEMPATCDLVFDD